jgi:vancomycin resistance protein YoaR
VPRLAPDVLRAQLAAPHRRIGEPARDATFDVSSGTPVVVPSRAGRTVSAEDLAAAVRGVLTEPEPRRATVPLTTAQPRLTTEQARDLGVVEVLGSFTSEHPCCRPRVQNIHRIADIVDGHVVLPGERFDLNAVVGPRDRARGFVEAPQILEGEFVDRVGGGVSQFATALFNAVFFSGLEDVEHSPHSYYLTRYPPGREATVSWPKPDLVFRNDSPHGVLIDTSYTDTSITVTFWGTKRFDEVRSETGPRVRLRDFDTRYVTRPDCTATDGQQGFDITVTRVFVQDGREVRREPFRTRYKPEPRFICGPPPPGASP